MSAMKTKGYGKRDKRRDKCPTDGTDRTLSRVCPVPMSAETGWLSRPMTWLQGDGIEVGVGCCSVWLMMRWARSSGSTRQV